MKKIYLAIPYSRVDKELAFKVVNIITAQLMNERNIVFSPISHSHCVAKENSLPTSWDYWEAQDRSFIEWCDEVHVVVMGKDGIRYIEESVGVQAELEIASQLHKPIKYIEWKTGSIL